MKKMHFMLSWVFCFLIIGGAKSQENQNQAFWIHEDRVKPGLVQEYEKHSKDLVQMARDNNFQEMGWSVAQLDDGTFLSITPIKDFAHLQSLSFTSLQEKVGQEKFLALMDGFNEFYDEHGDYIAILDNSLSYMPNGPETDRMDNDFRKWHFMKIPANKVSEVRQKLVELKDMYTKKNSRMHYRIYRSGFGQMGNTFTAVISAKDAEDYSRISAENDKLLGDEGNLKFEELFDLVSDYRSITGRMRPDLAYTPTIVNAEPIRKD